MTEVETKLFLVACAQTTLDEQGIFQGPSNHTLSSQGTRHAKLLSAHLKSARIDSFYASPYEGALRTASVLAAAHRRGVIKIPELRDMDFGQWTGKTMQELKESSPEQPITWQFTPQEHRMPGGETLEEVQARVGAALENVILVERGNGVCVVSHAIPIKAAMCHFMNEDLSIVWFTPSQDSTALNIIDFQNGEAQVTLIGSLEHLGKTTPAQPLERAAPYLG
jgi:broad specificity phosphatase PhoE